MTRYFLITESRTPVVAIKCKLTNSVVSDSFFTYEKVLKNIPRIQTIRSPGIDHLTAPGVRIVSADRF